eukprot:147692-Rhodomonas_salina.1
MILVFCVIFPRTDCMIGTSIEFSRPRMLCTLPLADAGRATGSDTGPWSSPSVDLALGASSVLNSALSADRTGTDTSRGPSPSD